MRSGAEEGRRDHAAERSGHIRLALTDLVLPMRFCLLFHTVFLCSDTVRRHQDPDANTKSA